MTFSSLSKEKLKKVIEPHFHEALTASEYDVNNIDPKNLLTHTRFDLSFKLLFLKMSSVDINLAKEAYEEHIKALTLGKFIEPGNSNKNSLNKYFKSFEDIHYDIKQNSFNVEKSVVPISSNGSIANGAHRVASSIVLNSKVPCVDLAVKDHIYDYKFFKARNVSKELLDIAACEFIENAQNVYLAIIWPSAVGKDEELESIIKNIVYRKEVKLNSNGAHNLLSQIYYGEDWIGSFKDNYKGAEGKLVECFKSFNEIRFVAFQSNNIDDVRKIKEKVRNIFHLGKHSIHISDSHIETLRISRLVFNENSIHFLNNAHPNRFISFHNKLKKYKNFLSQNNILFEDAVLDSGIVLSAYGLRETKDTDFLINNHSDLNFKFDLIDNHEGELKHHVVHKLELIYDQRNYFYFEDIKFISFSNLYYMKKNRNEDKDQNDLILMEALIESNFLKENYSKLKRFLHYQRIKLRQRTLNTLIKLGLYNIVKKIYKKIMK